MLDSHRNLKSCAFMSMSFKHKVQTLIPSHQMDSTLLPGQRSVVTSLHFTGVGLKHEVDLSPGLKTDEHMGAMSDPPCM